MPLFTMPKYLADNRIVGVLFVLLAILNSFAITGGYYG
jgi:hypothetical protein